MLPSEQPEAEISSSATQAATTEAQVDERDAQSDEEIALPAYVAGSGSLDRLVDQARDYAAAATAENTNKAYKADWKHFASWSGAKAQILWCPALPWSGSTSPAA